MFGDYRHSLQIDPDEAGGISVHTCDESDVLLGVYSHSVWGEAEVRQLEARDHMVVYRVDSHKSGCTWRGQQIWIWIVRVWQLLYNHKSTVQPGIELYMPYIIPPLPIDSQGYPGNYFVG